MKPGEGWDILRDMQTRVKRIERKLSSKEDEDEEEEEEEEEEEDEEKEEEKRGLFD